MNHNRYHRLKSSRFQIGDVVTVPGLDNAPTAKVVRHTQFDNGEVEILWFTPGQQLQRAWIAESLLQKPRREFAKGILEGRSRIDGRKLYRGWL